MVVKATEVMPAKRTNKIPPRIGSGIVEKKAVNLPNKAKINMKTAAT